MELTPIEKRYVNAMAILIMAKKKDISEAPEKLHEEILLRIKEIEVEKITPLL